uniref:Uncharacterized protein n=1 Tax=Anguilla anguilla TaxID=7936 RepID=A0A0E9VZL7_ANGAN
MGGPYLKFHELIKDSNNSSCFQRHKSLKSCGAILHTIQGTFTLPSPLMNIVNSRQKTFFNT